jgi:hypothetical protein
MTSRRLTKWSPIGVIDILVNEREADKEKKSPDLCLILGGKEIEGWEIDVLVDALEIWSPLKTIHLVIPAYYHVADSISRLKWDPLPSAVTLSASDLSHRLRAYSRWGFETKRAFHDSTNPVRQAFVQMLTAWERTNLDSAITTTEKWTRVFRNHRVRLSDSMPVDLDVPKVVLSLGPLVIPSPYYLTCPRDKTMWTTLPMFAEDLTDHRSHVVMYSGSTTERFIWKGSGCPLVHNTMFAGPHNSKTSDFATPGMKQPLCPFKKDTKGKFLLYIDSASRKRKQMSDNKTRKSKLASLVKKGKGEEEGGAIAGVSYQSTRAPS